MRSTIAIHERNTAKLPTIDLADKSKRPITTSNTLEQADSQSTNRWRGVKAAQHAHGAWEAMHRVLHTDSPISQSVCTVRDSAAYIVSGMITAHSGNKCTVLHRDIPIWQSVRIIRYSAACTISGMITAHNGNTCTVLHRDIPICQSVYIITAYNGNKCTVLCKDNPISQRIQSAPAVD